MATQLQHTPRTMSAIELDLRNVSLRLATLRADCIGRVPTPEQHNRWDDLESQQAKLRAEFCGTLHALTGMSWTRVANVMDVGVGK